MSKKEGERNGSIQGNSYIYIYISKRHQNGYTLVYIKSDKINFSKKRLQETNRTLYTDTRGQTQRGHINYMHVCVDVCVFIHTRNVRAPKYMKEALTELMGDISSFIILIGDFNIPLKIMSRKTIQAITKERETLNNTINQLDLTKTETLLNKVGNNLGHKTSLNGLPFSSPSVQSSSVAHRV